MFDRIGRSIELAKASLGVLRADKELLLFPLVSFIALVIVTAKRSGGLLRQTWGEQILGAIGVGLLFGLLAVLAIVIGAILAMLLVGVSTTLAIVAVIVTVLIVGVIALVGSAVSGIYTASLYRYATKGDAGNMFRSETLAAAFTQRR